MSFVPLLHASFTFKHRDVDVCQREKEQQSSNEQHVPMFCFLSLCLVFLCILLFSILKFALLAPCSFLIYALQTPGRNSLDKSKLCIQCSVKSARLQERQKQLKDTKEIKNTLSLQHLKLLLLEI